MGMSVAHCQGIVGEMSGNFRVPADFFTLFLIAFVACVALDGNHALLRVCYSEQFPSFDHHRLETPAYQKTATPWQEQRRLETPQEPAQNVSNPGDEDDN